MMDRRRFLTLGLAATASLIAAPAIAAPKSRLPERRIGLYNLHTGETVSTVYWAEGKYDRRALAAINRVLRDHRTDEIHAISPDVIDLLHQLSRRIGLKGPFQIISGYRSPTTNATLASYSDGVAHQSLHMSGQAVDIRVPGLSTRKLGRAAISLKSGGVGTYPKSNFVHVDSGRVRTW